MIFFSKTEIPLISLYISVHSDNQHRNDLLTLDLPPLQVWQEHLSEIEM